MKDHYDFSKGVRGKFHGLNATLKPPVYLDEQVQVYLTARAEEKGIDLSDLVNTMLMRDIELIEAVK